MHFRHRIQFHPVLAALLLLALGLLGSPGRVVFGGSGSEECAAFRKGGALLSALPGRDSRPAARKTPGPGGPLMDVQPGGSWEGGWLFRAAIAASPDHVRGILRADRGFPGRAPPRRA